MTRFASALVFLLFSCSVEARSLKGGKKKKYPVQLGPRPYYLVDSMKEGELKDKLTECAEKKTEFKPSDWSISHRGSTMMVSFKVYLYLVECYLQSDKNFSFSASVSRTYS